MKLPILLFDSKCQLCIRFTQALKLVDSTGLINYISIYDDEVYEKFDIINRGSCEEIIHLITEENQVLVGGEVIEFLINEIPAVKKFAWLIEPESSKKVVNAFYKQVNEVRKRVKKSGCTGCGTSKRKNI
jgi:predicted DCC family thiol-disulfide oxidoreductase YuxK